MKEIVSWSGDKRASFTHYYEPTTEAELTNIIKKHARIRIVGNAMSPNGVALEGNREGQDVAAVCMNKFVQVLQVNKEEKWVRAQSGVTLANLLLLLDEEGMTIPGLCVTTEPTLGGLIQAGCHGSGFKSDTAAPFDELVTKIKILDGDGAIHELDGSDGDLFLSARCALGSFGVVTEVWFKIEKSYFLREEVSVLSLGELRNAHQEMLGTYKHVRYFYYPYNDHVVAFVYREISLEEMERPEKVPRLDERELKRGFLTLLYERRAGQHTSSYDEYAEANASRFWFDLKMEALKTAPLVSDNIRRINEAELQFFRASQGRVPYRRGKNWEMLTFPAGALPNQYVKEFCFQIKDNGLDFDFAEDVLKLIESRGIPVPSLIGQYTPGSSSLISPVFSLDNRKRHAWFNMIMFPIGDAGIDAKLLDAFNDVYEATVNELEHKYCLQEHLGKAELTANNHGALVSRHIRASKQREQFHALRKVFDTSEKFISTRARLILNMPQN